MGTKKEHLKLSAGIKYKPNRVLMVGDAPGDYQAAKANNALFFPINPGHEEKSWELFYKKGIEKFVSGKYAGDYENKLVKEFEALLPENPNWRKHG